MIHLRGILLVGCWACLTLFPCAYSQSSEELLDKGGSHYRFDQLDSAQWVYQQAFQDPRPEIQLKALVGWVKASIGKSELPLSDSLLSLGEPLSQLPDISLPTLSSFYLIKGEYHRRNSQFAQALEQHKKVISMRDQLEGEALSLAEAYYYAALTFEKMDLYDSAIYYVDEAYALYKTQMDTTDVRFSSIYNGMGACYYRANRLEEARHFYLLSKSIAEEHLGPLSSDLALCLSNLSGIYRAEEDYESAIKSTEQALKIFRYLEDEAGISGAYYGLGVYHYYLGDYGRAKDYMEACIGIRERIYPSQHYSLIGPYQVLGIVLEESGQYEQTLEMLAQVNPIIIANYGQGSLTEGFNHENRAITLKILDQLDSALHYIQLAHDILPQHLSPNDYSLAINTYNFADILYQRGEYKQAYEMLRSSTKICEALGMDESVEYAQNLSLEGRIYMNQGKWTEGKEAFDRALAVVRNTGLESWKVDDYRLNPTALSVLNDYNEFLFNQYLSLPSQKNIDEFEKYVQLYLEVANRLRLQFVDPYTRSIISKNNSINYALNIGRFNQLYKQTGNGKFLEAAYRFAEFGRTSRLRDLQSEKIRSYSMLPDYLLGKERSLKKTVSGLYEESLSHPDSASIKEQLFEAKEALNKHISFTRDHYPAYHELTYSSEVPPISRLQKSLSQDENLLQFMLDDTAYYAFLVNSETYALFHVGKQEEIDQWVKQWVQSIVGLKKTDAGDALKTKLWDPIADEFKGKRITIVPEGLLYFLNFEALPKGEGYLIEDYNISYALSFTQLSSDWAQKGRGKLLAIAPGFEDEIKSSYQQELDSLEEVDQTYLRTLRQPWSLRYVSQLKRKFANVSFTGQQATESRVKEKLAQGRLIYFGTHAIADPEDPLRSRLILAKELGEQVEDGYLHAYEIYGIPLQAELAVLSACESGLGQLRRGEGMLSLAYSMHYAGCPSTAVSLWKVDEKVNTEITADFLELLGQGQSKSEALRRAKLNYLREAQGDLRHPFYWAGMVLMGKDGEVDLPGQFNYWGLGLLMLVIVSVVGIRWMRRKTRVDD